MRSKTTPDEESLSLIKRDENGGLIDEQNVKLLLELKKRKRDWKPFEKGRFIMLNQEAVQQLFDEKNKDLKGETLKLLMFYMSIVEYGNRIKGYTQTQIAEMMHLRQSQVSRANSDLLEMGIVRKEGKDLYFDDRFLQKGDKVKVK